jgi:putative oxidoreductase
MGWPLATIALLWSEPQPGDEGCVATALIARTNLADRNQEIHFLKNMAMMGGFLYVAAFGARTWSLDTWWSRRAAAG